MATAVSRIDDLLGMLQNTQESKVLTKSVGLEDILTELTPIDLAPLINRDPVGEQQVAAQITDFLHRFGVVVVRDPRVPYEKNANFIDMIEDYFSQETSQKMKDVRADLHFQVGATPHFTEKPRNHCARVETLDPNHRPITPCPPEKDPKWRYFWKMSPHLNQDETEFTTLNSPNVEPEGFPQFKELCNSWGDALMGAAFSIAEGLALGLDLPRDYFTSRMRGGPHLVAPTATDMTRFGDLGTVFAGYHYDLNFLTVHGKSRYPGLYVWLEDGRRVRVRVPDGCLIAQSAKQMEWLTGGFVYAGFHEVVCTKETRRAIERQRAAGRPLWRISSTFFSHIRSDETLQVIDRFANEDTLAKYPPITTGEQVMQELQAIKLAV